MPKAAKKITPQKATHKNSDGLEYVIATLPNGAKLNLYGDAVVEAKKKRKPSKFEEASAEQIEKWAMDAIQGFDAKQELALITLLHYLSRSNNAANDASTALYAAYRECSGLHDAGIDHVIAGGAL